jgi:putative PIN family toxin of toxin-antitoxin system
MLAVGGGLQMCITGEIYAEYEEVISRPRFAREPGVITAALAAIREKGLWVKPTRVVTVCLDPDDDIFLECAEAAQAFYLVTGNQRHFPAFWKTAEIVTARRMLDILHPGPAIIASE